MKDAIQESCRASMAARLEEFPRREIRRPDLKHSAVAVCVTRGTGIASLLLTRRAPRMRAYAGQWALPGGRRDAGETTVDAALRELREEIGITLQPTDVLGLLDDYATRSGYIITPVVFWARDIGEPVPSEGEVASVHEIPLGDLDVQPRFITIPESEFPVIQVPVLGRYIHAPTAAIIYQFCQVARRGRITRVAHFEQPVSSWS
ncbi:NUDIX hydrolase [Blastococcus saxobsidens]|uniref:Putative NUDIX hydrolase n=1 Tax=Blastococcus saxobsidens (strain DD2) TaxID=1146883 RepID=H6RNQ8_BLASD|nr:CoA pyrophosphatase [Blastococcus saxobsidens]CCG05206.1 putative NUDIX hydrolase [Blastococcus saxobsidens DD2]